MQKSFGSAFKVGSRAANVVIPFLADKIGDPKYCAGIQDIILILGEKLTPAFIIKGVSKQGISATNPKVIEQIAIIIEKVLNEFGPAGFPLQEAVAFAVYGC